MQLDLIKNAMKIVNWKSKYICTINEFNFGI